MSDAAPWIKLYAEGQPARITAEYPNALAMFEAAVQRAAERPALLYFDGSLSYAELDRLSDALACGFIARGVGRGDRVALFLQNLPQFVIALIASWKAGAIAVSINPMNRERELGLLLADCQPKVLLCQDNAHEIVAAALQTNPVELLITTSSLDFQQRDDARVLDARLRQSPPPRLPGSLDFRALIERHAGSQPPPQSFAPDDTALLVYTSGTTGLPKGAMNTHGNLTFTAQVYRDWIKVREGAPVLAIAPLFHITGLIGHIGLSLLNAAPLILCYRFEPGVMLDALREHQPEFTIGAITALIALMNHPDARSDSLASLCAIYSGGAPIALPVVEQFEARFGLYIHNAYGLTETTSPSTVTPLNRRGPVDPAFGALSVGVPTFNTEVRIVDTESGATLGPGTAGEIMIRGPQVIAGYWNKPKETAAALNDGWLATGDIGALDAAGWLYLVDRKKDMINAAGYKVWPREVEDVLYAHPAVREAAVVGVADAYRGETVKAVLSLKPGHTLAAEEVIAFCKARMAAYKYPRIVEFLPELPKTATGKILRRELR